MIPIQEEPLYELDTERNLLEIQGVTCDRNYVHVVGIYALLCIIPCSLLYLWSAAGIVTSLFVLVSIIQDVRGRQGWIRGLLLKHCGKNIISWYHERIPTQANKRPDVVPSVIIALPYTVHHIKRWPFILIFCIWTCVISLPLIAGMTTPMSYAWLCGILLSITLICFALPTSPPQKKTINIERHNKIRSVWNKKERKRHLVVLLYEDGINGGGLTTFLQNYRDFVPTTDSFVLHFEESEQQQFFFPSSILGTKRPKETLSSLFSEPVSSLPSSTYATYSYGWSTIVAHTPFSEESIEEILSLVDTVE